jgi:polyisoprenoid-binding protein YceI
VRGADRHAPRVARAAGLGLALVATAALSSARAVPAVPPQSPAPDLVFELNPADTKVNFTLGTTLHTVHGTFQPLRGRIEYSGATGALRGEIVVDAASGVSGDASRDRRMHAEILESEKYPAITFRPDHVDGKLAAAGEFTLQVHGTFTIHGADHDLTVPARAQLDGNRWTASAHFTVPYVHWGMKNPSVFVLRVNKTVDVDIAATGTLAPASR